MSSFVNDMIEKGYDPFFAPDVSAYFMWEHPITFGIATIIVAGGLYLWHRKTG